MSSREDEFAARIRAHLDRSAGELRPGLAYRLQTERAEALARLSGTADAVPVGSLAGAHGLAGGGAGFGSMPRPHRSLFGQARFWVGVLALAATSFGYHQWTIWSGAQETAELDVELLSSDLPFDAYLDRGFQNWLTTSFDGE
jgi:hypothetical protein